MTTVHEAAPGDVYVDDKGQVWRVEWVCREPTVGMVKLHAPDEEPNKASGGVSGLIWDCFRRIYSRTFERREESI